jgi:hypothetical protein
MIEINEQLGVVVAGADQQLEPPAPRGQAAAGAEGEPIAAQVVGQLGAGAWVGPAARTGRRL